MSSRLLRIGLVGGILGAAAGCGLIGGPSSESPQEVYGNPANLELPEVRVATLPTLDNVPLHLAIEQGYFEREGLNVKVVPTPQGGVGVTAVIAGAVDIAFGSYTPAIRAQYQDVAKKQGGLKLVADATSLGDGTSLIMVPPGSPAQDLSDLRGKVVAVVGLQTMTRLLTAAALRTNDVDPASVKFVEIPFQNTEAALLNGRVDAAFLTEPFVTAALKVGVQSLYDTNDGPVDDIPLTGYVATGDFVSQNPATLAAFQRAIQRGTKLAAERRDLVEPIVVKTSFTEPSIARIMKMTKFQTSLDPKRLQRVADLMLENGLLGEYFDVGPMIVPRAPLEARPTG